MISRFDFAKPHAPVLVDRVSLKLAETPPGDYRLVVEITDAATGRKASTATTFTIRE